jgi:K+-sensing histidine kinase KdpD
MTNTPKQTTPLEPNLWAEKSPDAVLELLVYDIYGPVSALGGEVDRLSTGAFEDEELVELLSQIRDRVNELSRLVVQLKRYNAERRAAGLSAEPNL